MTLTPAYGRDYKSKKAVLADFNSNKDFVVTDMFSKDCGRYINKEQLKEGDAVSIRYNSLKAVICVTV